MKKILCMVTLCLAVLLLLSSCKQQNPAEILGLESGEYPNLGAVCFMNEPTVQVGEVCKPLETCRFWEPDEKTAEILKYDDLEIDVWAEDPEVLEIVSVDRDKLAFRQSYDGITVKGLRAGSTKVYIKLTYVYTGGTFTDETTVTVVDPAEAAE